jgi:hypothetical protein
MLIKLVLLVVRLVESVCLLFAYLGVKFDSHQLCVCARMSTCLYEALRAKGGRETSSTLPRSCATTFMRVGRGCSCIESYKSESSRKVE